MGDTRYQAPTSGGIPPGFPYADPATGGVWVAEVGSPTFYTWQGVPGAKAALSAALTAWATSQTWTLGEVRKSAAGHALGCVVAGAGATSGTGPDVTLPRGSGANAAAPIVDGAAQWIDLGFARSIIVINADASLPLYCGNSTTGTSSLGGAIAPGFAGRQFQMTDPGAIFVAGAGSGFTVEVYP